MQPDSPTDSRRRIQQLISAVGSRQWFSRVALTVGAGAATGMLIGAVAYLAGWPGPAGSFRIFAALLAAALVIALTLARRSRRDAAEAIERACPASLNLVVTAEELERHPDRVSAAMGARIATGAARAVANVRASDVVPLGRAYAALACAVAAAILISPRGQTVVQQAVANVVDSVRESAGVGGSVRVSVEPPAYTGRKPVQLVDPERIEALEGSRIRFELPPGWRVRFGNAAPAADVIARDSGYFAVEAPAAGAPRRLIPLSVTPDRAPTVRIDAPARDLLLPDDARTIPVAISATDDLGLQMLELRYTKVSGTGEQFEFVEGALPVTLERNSAREWRADARMALGSLQLGPGDSLVYRAVARDQRSGDAGLASSDTYFIEIAGPGQVALEGVDMPPELERYAMSQQMIVLKIERLRARENTLASPALIEETASIAAEQRTVRANFVFLLGGHVEDEEVEAEQSHEIQEGRLENTARKEINAAISMMTRAEQGLTAVNTAAALPPAREAVEALQRAFGRSRYLLRSLAVRGRLDPSRRLTGDVKDAADWRRVSQDAEPREGIAARQLLDGLLDAAEHARAGGTLEPGRLQRLAEAALAIDPSSAVWLEVSRQLLEARDAAALQKVIARVAPETLRGALSRTPLSNAESALLKAFKEARR